VTKRELRDAVTHATLDAFGTERNLVVTFAFAPLMRSVCISDRHPHDRDRRVHTAERNDAGNAAARANDHAAADLLPQDSVRRADVIPAFGRDRGRLEAQTVFANRCRGRVDDGVVRSPARLQGQVETGELELDSGHLGSEHAKRFLQQFLAGFVPFQHDDRFVVHVGGD